MFRPPYHVELRDVPFPLSKKELEVQIARYDREHGDWAKRKPETIPDIWHTDKTSAAYGDIISTLFLLIYHQS